MLYFAADPFCRVCVRGARRAWAARIATGVAAVMLTLTLGTAVMVWAIPSHARPFATSPPIRHVENCRPFDQWLAEARRDLERNRPRGALHDLSLSRRDCSFDPERDRIEALAYDRLGDKFAAIAAATRFLDAQPDQRARDLLDAVSHPLPTP